MFDIQLSPKLSHSPGFLNSEPKLVEELTTGDRIYQNIQTGKKCLELDKRFLSWLWDAGLRGTQEESVEEGEGREGRASKPEIERTVETASEFSDPDDVTY